MKYNHHLVTASKYTVVNHQADFNSCLAHKKESFFSISTIYIIIETKLSKRLQKSSPNDISSGNVGGDGREIQNLKTERRRCQDLVYTLDLITSVAGLWQNEVAVDCHKCFTLGTFPDFVLSKEI